MKNLNKKFSASGGSAIAFGEGGQKAISLFIGLRRTKFGIKYNEQAQGLDKFKISAIVLS